MTELAGSLLFFGLAFLYSSVGHAGASGYLAAMALLGTPAATMKPVALCLNIVVAIITTITFSRAGQLPWRSLLPLVLGSAPLAFLGGSLALPPRIFLKLVGALLWLAAFRLAQAPRQAEEPLGRVPFGPGLVLGGGIGLGAGLTGNGGGIFLTPTLIFLGWESARRAAGISAAFILVNSVAGLAGAWPSLPTLPASLLGWTVAVVLGGLLGARFGSRTHTLTLRRLLAVVLVIAGAKLMWVM